jgi:hypothetical protein
VWWGGVTEQGAKVKTESGRFVHLLNCRVTPLSGMELHMLIKSLSQATLITPEIVQVSRQGFQMNP